MTGRSAAAAVLLLLGACVTAGKVQNPAPAEDLGAVARVEPLLRVARSFEGRPALRARIWLRSPAGTTIILPDSGVALHPALAPDGLVSRAELSQPAAPGTGPRIAEFRVDEKEERAVTAYLPLPADGLRPGAEYLLTVAWREEKGDGWSPGVSRRYVVKVERTNYGVVLGLGWLLGAAVVAVAGEP